MKLSFRTKLLAVVGATAVAFVILILASSVTGERASLHLTNIRERYLPKVELRPQLDGDFERLRRGYQDAVAAHDPDLLAGAHAIENALLTDLAAARSAVDPAEADAARGALDDYCAAADNVSRRLIAGETGERLVLEMTEMQNKQTKAGDLLKKVSSFDRGELTAAFAAAAAAQSNAGRVRLVISASCLTIVLILSLAINRGLLASLAQLTGGLQRFALGDFARPIDVVSKDELGSVAAQANQMAKSLERLGAERQRTDWLKSGHAGLAEEVLGVLSPREVADRALAFLARYIEAPVGALYWVDAEGSFRLLGAYARSIDGRDAGTPAVFRAGEGLVGQAALRSEITIVSAPPPDYLRVRSALGEAAPRVIALVPLVHLGQVRGVVELAHFQPWTDLWSELWLSVRDTLTIALEVARARDATRDLLAETRRQAERLAQQEEALRAANEELQAQQGELVRSNVELEDKAKELTTASAYKSQFLANMSHELRTPLNAIIGFSELMYDGAVPPDSPRNKEFLGDILKSGRHLLQLINDVLDLAKVESGKVEFHPESVNPTQLVSEILAVLRTTAAEKRVRLEHAVDAGLGQLVLDPARLKQVLYNYVSNAIKFTPDGGQVHVRLVPDGSERFRLEVEDTGIGIADDDIARLFVEFQQLPSGAKRKGGTGLGLALTKRLVEAQGGFVSVTSVLDKGSTFCATLPRRAVASSVVPGPARALAATAAAAGKGAAAASVTGSPVVGGPRVLVVEDSPADQQVLVDVLTHAGYAVEVAATGAQALAMSRERTYAAITLDLFLPDANGLDVLRQIRAERANRDVPVIVITVVAERGSIAGFAVHDILPKPVRDDELLAALRKAGVPSTPSNLVLVVDDDPAALRLMSASLEQLGYRARCAQTGQEGLRALKDAPLVAVILDLIMPGMDGFAFLDRLRHDTDGSALPVIVWTNKDLTTQEREILRSSASAVVSKKRGGGSAVLSELRAFLKPAPAPARSA